MEPFDVLAIVVRWVHLLSVVVAIGGTIFMRFVLMPSAQEALTPDVRTALHAKLITRWKRVVHICIALLIITGSFNFYVTFGDGVKALPYHPIFGVKLILAFSVFFLASALSGSSPGFAGIRENSKKWSAVLIALAVLAIMLSGVLKAIHVAALTAAPG